MNPDNSILKQTLLDKQQILIDARNTLKKEFFGIDHIIDQIVDSISSWFFLPQLQEKPLVVNLWGLTGTGKTSLVARLSQLLNFSDSYFWVDLGGKGTEYSFNSSMSEIYEVDHKLPIILVLDEFQHSRTILHPFNTEVEKDENRRIWDFMDTGKITSDNWSHGGYRLEDAILRLKGLYQADIKVKNGMVVDKLDLWSKEMQIYFDKAVKTMPFVPEEYHVQILNYAGEHLGIYLISDIKKLLFSFDAAQTIHFLNKVMKHGRHPVEKKFTKALIFVMGNLDEAYSMNDDLSTDKDADEFHRLSLKITVPKIKLALQKRFRSEQVARLGNIHIIFPSLNRKAYEQIIAHELDKYAQNLSDIFQLKVVFLESVHEAIYAEGVYPTQGARPVFTTILQILKSKISYFYTEFFLSLQDIDRLEFSVKQNKMVVDYQKDDHSVFTRETELITSLTDARRGKKDDFQAIIAVHESGHAVLSMVLMNTIPSVIYSVTADGEDQGFANLNYPWNYISRRELVPRLAVLLGGYASEEMIFGKENLTTGAASDIEKATEFISEMFQLRGMGSFPIKYGLPIPNEKFAYHQYQIVDEEVKKAMAEALALAEATLKREKKLLLHLADNLSDNGMLTKKEIQHILKNYSSRNIHIIENADLRFYRNHLKEQVKSIKISNRNPTNIFINESLKNKN